MDYEAEQAMELEALEAIFPEQLEEYEGSLADGWSRHGKTWAITITPAAEVADDDEEPEHELVAQLVWAHTPNYPDEPPCIRLRSVKGLSDAELAEATAELQRHVQEGLGMAMIYTLVTAAQEWLAGRLAAGPSSSGLDPEAEERRLRDEAEAARAAARAHGTHVTAEAFEAWRKRFEAEAALAKASLAPGGRDDRAGRLTGKAWFLQQMAAGKVQSGSEEEEEYEAEEEEEGEGVAAAASGDDDEDDDDDDLDYDDDDDDDDEGMLDEYLQSKTK